MKDEVKQISFYSSLRPPPSSLKGLYAYCLSDEVTDHIERRSLHDPPLDDVPVQT